MHVSVTVHGAHLASLIPAPGSTFFWQFLGPILAKDRISYSAEVQILSLARATLPNSSSYHAAWLLR